VSTDTVQRCDFCGERPAVYVDGFYVCDSVECDNWLTEACQEREADMREEFESQFR